MEILVAYDVNTKTSAGRRRLRHVARACQDYGQRVQKSVFQCTVNDMQYETLKARLQTCMDKDLDSLRLYRLPSPKEQYIECFGINPEVDFTGPLIV